MQNSQHFVQLLSQFTLTEDDILISLTMEFFTTIPVPDVVESVWEHITAVNLPQDISSLHCVSSTFFIHWGKFCQIQEATMGFLLCLLLATIFMMAFEVEAVDCSLMKSKC
jgi:hypothetical protein